MCIRDRDPVGLEDGWETLVAIYIKYVMTGVNYLNKETVRSATCRGYAISVGQLFSLRNCPNPVDFDDETNWTRTLVNNLEREENVACQRNHLSDRIHAEVINMASKAGPYSVEAAVADIITSGKSLGLRASEHSQTSSDKVDYHEYPSKNKVMKAINAGDVICSDKNRKIFQVKTKADLDKVHKVVITFRHQKNRQNGQEICLLVDKTFPKICAARSIANMLWRKKET